MPITPGTLEGIVRSYGDGEPVQFASSPVTRDSPYLRAFLMQSPMKAGDGHAFQDIAHGHIFSHVTMTCACGVTKRDYLSAPSLMNRPCCSIAFPMTGGCSLSEWNAGLAAMKERGQSGSLSMVPVKSTHRSVVSYSDRTSESSEEEEVQEPPRRKRRLLP